MSWSFYDANGKLLQGVLAGSVDTTELADDAVTSAKIADGAIVNADINASAVIAYSKLAALADGNILVGNGSNVAVSVNPSGDVDIANDGTFSIATGAVVNADVNSSAAIAYTKLAALTDGNILVGNGSNVAVSVSPSGDIDVSNAGVLSLNSTAISGFSAKTSIADADTILLGDSAASGALKKMTKVNFVAGLGGATINNATANELVTVASTTTQLDAEANLTFDGNNLAIGQSSSVAPLQVHKETAVSDPYATFAITSRDNLSGASGNFGMAWQQVNASNVVQTTRGHLFFNNQTNNMQMETHSTGMFVLSDVRFKIEHTTGQAVLDIKDTNSSGTAANGFIRIQDQNDAQVGYMGKGSSNGSFQIANESAEVMTFSTSGLTRLTIAADGSFSGSATADISDSRIKENVENTTVGLAEILQLRPVRYNFISGKGWGESGQKFYGFLAQEVEAIIPEAVETADIDIDEMIAGAKRDPNGISDLKSVTMTQITTALVKAVQELKAEVDALRG